MTPEKYTPEQIKDALKLANGFVYIASQNLGCDAKTIYNYMERYPEIKEYLQEIREHTNDFVESKILQRINQDADSVMIFYAKTKMKHRGYIERVENLNVERTTFDDLPSLEKL